MTITYTSSISTIMMQRNLYTATNSLNKSLTRLSTGLKINSASDDAAGLTISESLKSTKRGADVSIQNAQSGVNLLQTAEDSLKVVQDNLQKIRELAVQAANDTNSSAERDAIKQEITQLKINIDKNINSAKYNDISLFGETTTEVITETTGTFTDESLPAAISRPKASAEYNGKLYVFGENGTCYSYDGTTWIDTELSGVSNPIDAVECNGKLYVAGNSNGTLYKYDETNGWVDTGLGGIANPGSIAEYNGEVYVFELGSNRCKSYDGNSWTNRKAPGSFSLGAESLEYNGKLYSISSTACYSYDGSTWKNENMSGPSTATSASVYNGDLYVFGFGNDSCYKYNGSTWTQVSMPGGASGVDGPIESAVFNGKLYVSGDNNGSLYSFDGTNWQDIEMTGVNGPRTMTGYDGKLFICGYGNDTCYSYTLDSSSVTSTSSCSVSIQVGSSDVINISSGLSTTSFTAMTGISSIDSYFTSTGFDKSFISLIDNGINEVSSMISNIGSSQNRLDSIIKSLGISSENNAYSISTIRDTDMAVESSNILKEQILQESTTNLLVQANQSPSLALSLLNNEFS